MILGELNERFQQQSFSILQEMEDLLIKSCNAVQMKPSAAFCTMYKDGLQMDRLTTQLSTLPDLLKTVNDQQRLGIRKVTSIGTVNQLMNANDFSKTFLSQLDQLLRIYLTIPMTSTTAKRSFSTLRRLKSYLRSTMTQKRLNHVLLHTHKDWTDEINVLQLQRNL